MTIIKRIGMALGLATLFTAGLLGTASADTSNSNTNEQSGTNTATSNQAAAAVSGNATATDDSVATSGAASAAALSSQAQVIWLDAMNQAGNDGASLTAIATGTDVTNTNSNGQTAANDGTNGQDIAAVSGNADASDASEATTNNAQSVGQSLQEQVQQFFAQNQVINMPEEAPAP